MTNVFFKKKKLVKYKKRKMNYYIIFIAFCNSWPALPENKPGKGENWGERRKEQAKSGSERL